MPYSIHFPETVYVTPVVDSDYGYAKNSCAYRSLTKKGQVSNICPPPYFALISCKGLKFTLKSAHPVDLAR